MLSLTGCSAKSYTFKESVDEIESIEIVSAESSLEFTVIKTLSDAEEKDFLEQFQTIKFRTYYIGDPMFIHGDAIKITYKNGAYEMICFFWSEYIENGKVYPVRKSCDEKVFNTLINGFLMQDIYL